MIDVLPIVGENYERDYKRHQGDGEAGNFKITGALRDGKLRLQRKIQLIFLKRESINRFVCL